MRATVSFIHLSKESIAVHIARHMRDPQYADHTKLTHHADHHAHIMRDNSS